MTSGKSYEGLDEEGISLWPEFYEAQAGVLLDSIHSTIHQGIIRLKDAAKSRFEQYPIRDVQHGQGDFSGVASYRIVIRLNTYTDIDGTSPRRIVVELPKGLLVPIDEGVLDDSEEITEVSNKKALGVALILVDGGEVEVGRLFITKDRLFRYEKGKEYTLFKAKENTDSEPITEDIVEEIIDLDGDAKVSSETINTRMVVEDSAGELVEVPALSLQEANEIIGQILQAIKHSTVQDQSPD